MLHLLAHDKPAASAPRKDDEAYEYVWWWVSAAIKGNLLVDVRSGDGGAHGKTALQAACLQKNEIAMCGLLQAGAGFL